MKVGEALRARISVRKFLPKPLPEAVMRGILDDARFSPSGGNMQPWRVIAVTGQARDAVCALAKEKLAQHAANEEGKLPVYPDHMWEPYRTRRFKVGEDMYSLLGIAREDKPARLAHVTRNFEFFDAPVGLFFVIDTRFGHSEWAHMGMFMQSVALAAIERGVASCFQEFWVRFRDSLAAHFELGEDEVIVSGMALGYADDSAPVNSLRSEREAVDAFATFKGF